MVRIVVDQSHTTHVQTCIISCSDQYCNTQHHNTYWTDHIQTHDYILIEDDGFDRIITQLSRYTAQPCTVNQFKTIINREIALGQIDHHISTQIMTFLISETKVNHAIVTSPRGHSGQIQCEVQLIMLKTKQIPKHIVAECKKGLVHIIPKSLYTIEYLNKHTKWSDYALVYLCEYMVKCIVIKNGQYHTIEYLNRGLKELKQLMEDSNVGQYYYHQQCTHINHLTRQLITQAVDQYSSILGQRLSHHLGNSSSIALINHICDHHIISEQLNNHLSQNYGFYTIECSHALPRISRNGNIDGQVYLHQLNQHSPI